MEARTFESSSNRRTLLAACVLVVVPAALGIAIGWWTADLDLRKALYAGAVTLVFAGLVGGLLKVLLDDMAAFRRRREDAAQFVVNVLADLKDVFDQVARARILIPAHQSVLTYGEEMRALIGARVKLRNVVRALERRADGLDERTRTDVTALVRRMDDFVEGLTCEFREHYKGLSDQQRSYEERARALVKQFAEDPARQMPPELPDFVWRALSALPHLADFIGAATDHAARFERPLDEASACLRNELARILGGPAARRGPASRPAGPTR